MAYNPNIRLYEFVKRYEFGFFYSVLESIANSIADRAKKRDPFQGRSMEASEIINNVEQGKGLIYAAADAMEPEEISNLFIDSTERVTVKKTIEMYAKHGRVVVLMHRTIQSPLQLDNEKVLDQYCNIAKPYQLMGMWREVWDKEQTKHIENIEIIGDVASAKENLVVAEGFGWSGKINDYCYNIVKAGVGTKPPFYSVTGGETFKWEGSLIPVSRWGIRSNQTKEFYNGYTNQGDSEKNYRYSYLSFFQNNVRSNVIRFLADEFRFSDIIGLAIKKSGNNATFYQIKILISPIPFITNTRRRNNLRNPLLIEENTDLNEVSEMTLEECLESLKEDVNESEKIIEKTQALQIAEAKLAGQHPWESWETESGLSEWIEQLQKEIQQIDQNIEQGFAQEACIIEAEQQ